MLTAHRPFWPTDGKPTARITSSVASFGPCIATHASRRLPANPTPATGQPPSMASARAALLLRRQCLGAAAANPYLFSGHGLRYRKLEVILTTVTPPPVPSSRHASSVANLLFDTTLRCGSEAVALGQF